MASEEEARLKEVEKLLAENEAKVTDIYNKELAFREDRLKLRDERQALTQERRDLHRRINPTYTAGQGEGASVEVEGEQAQGNAEVQG